MPILQKMQKLNRLNSLKKMGLIGTVATLLSSPVMAEVHRTKIDIPGGYLKIEVLDDDLLHVEYGTGNGPATSSEITTTPMIFKKDYQGPDSIQAGDSQLLTDELRVDINSSGCLTIHDLNVDLDVTTICPDSLTASPKRLSMKKNSLNQVYGLGQKLTDVYKSDANGDWLRRGGFGTDGGFGHSFGSVNINGNYAGGSSGQLQFPIMYAAGDQGENIAVLLDNQFKQNWSLSGSWWNVSMYGEIRFYVMTGDSLLDLRKDYMELTGTAPVPPKKAFGLWVSEFGYEDWNEVDNTLGSLRNRNFPVDGFVLDLLWFGGYHQNSSSTPMGTLTWDEGRFPNPSGKIASYKNDDIGLIAIEESYVGTGSDSFSSMNNQGYLAKYCGSNSAVTISDWIGKVGMVDWSNPNGSAWWHDNRRKPNLIDKGIFGHWTDLGEPEKYNASACYYGINGDNSHGALHNLYNFKWTESIYDGYVRNHSNSQQRPFSLTRAGTVGTHRFGAAMWSGDIGGRLDHMAASLNAQMHLSFAGIDYYGSDIGGFWRFMSGGDTNAPNGASQSEMYTLWFANSAWFDVPVRPHGMAYEGFSDVSDQCPQNCQNETSPAKMGNTNSNLLNIRQRYELTPYYYSLAHRAYLTGEPVIAPLVMYYQNDANVKGMGNEKLVGENLLVAMAYKQYTGSRDVYLPAGTWIDFHTNRWIDSNGQWLRGESIWIEDQNRNRLPAYAKAGAIIPKMHVDSQTKDVFGSRKDGSSRNELIVQVYADEQASEFTLYEDDGTDVESYDTNKRPIYDTRSVLLTQQVTGETIQVTINAAQGDYAGVSERNNEVRLIVRDKTASAVFVNGETLAAISRDEFYAQSDRQGWYQESTNELRIRTGIVVVNETQAITVYTGTGPVAPVANAGVDFEINMGELATLDGSISNDVNNDITNYSWSNAEFTASLTGVSATFTFDVAGEYDVTLTVTDSEGNTDSDIVKVTVLDPNAPVAPVARAGNDIQVNISELVSFDASNSTDFNDDITSYTWSSAAFGEDLSGENSSFSFAQAGVYQITLTVTDSANLSGQDTVQVTVIDPNACDYQFSQVYFRGTSNSWGKSGMTKVGNCIWEIEQDFDGSADDRFKFDIKGDWSHNYGDTGANGSLERSGSDIFLNDGAGTYIIAMNDEFMTYTVIKKPNGPSAPVADAGQNMAIKVGSTITLNGSNSSDSDGTITSYSWDNGFGLGEMVSATFNEIGIFTVNLTVTDNDGSTATDSIIITVEANAAPVADAGVDQTVKVGSTVILDASASSDRDGSISAYSWSSDLGNSDQVSVLLNTVGDYSYTVTVTDNNGASSTDTIKVIVKELPEDIDTSFTCNNGHTSSGYSVYVVGNTPELGNWSVASSAQKLSPTSYPTWKRTITLPANATVKWKCVIAKESSLTISSWQGGSNNLVTTGSSGTKSTTGSF